MSTAEFASRGIGEPPWFRNILRHMVGEFDATDALLRACRQRPRRRGTDRTQNFAPSHESTQSARGETIALWEALVGVGQCPLWVISGPWAMSVPCLDYPRKQTFDLMGLPARMPTASPNRASPQHVRFVPIADMRAAARHPYSITSSARARISSGTFKPSAIATVTLIAKSNFVGCSTGRSPGFAPRRILST